MLRDVWLPATLTVAMVWGMMCFGCGGSADRPDRGVIVGKRDNPDTMMFVNNQPMFIPGSYEIRVCGEKGDPFYVTVNKAAFDAAKPGMQWVKE